MMEAGAEISVWVAVLGGVISFLSPCVLPLAPPYLCFIAGASLNELEASGNVKAEIRRRVVTASLAFIMGFSTVFIALGATASIVGQVLREHLTWLSQVAGVLIILMGAHFLGVFRLRVLSRELRYHGFARPAGPAGAYVVGLAFAFGWTPCIGPVLAVILSLAATQESIAHGAGLLASYSAGLGIPFLLAAFAVHGLLTITRRFSAYYGVLEKMTGGLLVLTGILFLSGDIQSISFWLLEIFPALGGIG